MTRFFPDNVWHLLVGIVFHLFLQSATAAAPAEINATASFDHVTVSNTTSVQAKVSSEILSYNLPYGGLGFLSHVLTYYTALCIGIGVRPLSPWKDTSRKCEVSNYLLAIVQLIASNVVAVITMYRCRKEWEFILISSWHVFLSTTLGVMVIHRASLRKDDDSRGPFIWLAFYVIGVIGGLVGVFSLVIRTWEIQAVKDITYAFGSVGTFLALICAIFWLRSDGCSRLSGLSWRTMGVTVLGAVSLTGSFAAWYSDWVLGVMAGNIEGGPGDGPGRGANAAFWWIYFMSKRLPMFVQ